MTYLDQRENDAFLAKRLGHFVVKLPNGDYSLGPAIYYTDPDSGERKLHNPVPQYRLNPELWLAEFDQQAASGYNQANETRTGRKPLRCSTLWNALLRRAHRLFSQ